MTGAQAHDVKTPNKQGTEPQLEATCLAFSLSSECCPGETSSSHGSPTGSRYQVLFSIAQWDFETRCAGTVTQTVSPRSDKITLFQDLLPVPTAPPFTLQSVCRHVSTHGTCILRLCSTL